MKTFHDGREVLSTSTIDRREYKRRTQEMRLRQHCACAICGGWIEENEATFDHQEGRGMGGSRRDDRILVDGEWYNAAVCFGCNNFKGSRHYHWINNRYCPVYVRISA